MFESQIGKNIRVYIDDMVVKSKLASEHMKDLTDIFEILRDTNSVLMPPNALLSRLGQVPRLYGDSSRNRGEPQSN